MTPTNRKDICTGIQIEILLHFPTSVTFASFFFGAFKMETKLR